MSKIIELISGVYPGVKSRSICFCRWCHFQYIRMLRLEGIWKAYGNAVKNTVILLRRKLRHKVKKIKMHINSHRASTTEHR